MKLASKQTAVFKLVLWSCLLVWMVFFLSLSMVIAQRAAVWGPEWFGTQTMGQVLTFIFPVWVMFTSLLIVVGIMRWVSRKLMGKIPKALKGETEEEVG